ncbi:DUF2971 domain-containing protein [Tenacibaculum finnmarkense]|uniref:DUF2971 domain-containing protein n=1 Tax=Tenacibaculum finnmarkense TaxID=2781243 RepID=UPI001EFAC189|nr:DUF2971 domain-containing protein [Tenacibaculum finnmarkense]WBX67888.1 DUF2971 domain-containing protein [Tenacibaculum dicentrarchi]MCG8786474.1 DUF2971 domain-containing protein [Tenacibaculum finnmarkense]MCG8804043.1 DUF2971 domain-containing protein [Tenacibaculum finnmarkense]MCG8813985.1 DUF2971 domain-containing protein [Tenacibaculum finnmarkense]MCG8826768.1 DUF2971 domain-containing protein [Tenacibaculum finnmarkense]
MLSKIQIEEIIRESFFKILRNETIFKYESFDTAFDKIILGKTLMFSNPSTFNDPFDCNEYLLKPEVTDEMFDRAIDSLGENLTIEYRNRIKNNLKNPENVAGILREEKAKFKMSCFSKISDETLMWSHYADKHNGICVGFKFPIDYQEKFILCGVRYENEVKPIDGATDFVRTSLYWLTTKSERWAYENEVRAITKTIPEKDRQTVEFDGQHIKEIIFGCNVSSTKINESIININKTELKENGIKFYRMEIDKSSFLLKKISIKPCT